MSSRKVNIKSPARVRAKLPAKTDEFELIVRDLTSDGRGVGEAPDGQVVFVSGVWQGERVRVRRTRQGSKVDIVLIDIMQGDERRVIPLCNHHRQDQCGGCPWMFVSYEAQLSAKTQKLSQALSALAPNLRNVVIHPSPRQLGYRNRAQLKTNGRILGYVKTGSHDIADIASCAVLTAQNQSHLARLRTGLPNTEWRPKSKHKWVTLDIDDRRSTPLVNRRQAFRQGNDDQNAFMREWLAHQLTELSASASVVELFCGSGNLTSVIAAGHPKYEITAVEGDELALRQLTSLGLPNVETQQRNLFDRSDISALLATLPQRNGIILDPPRDGLKTRDVLTPLFSKSPWVVYLSCNVATWQRDAHFLQDQGLTLTRAEGLDMFPQTPHLEVLSVFERQ